MIYCTFIITLFLVFAYGCSDSNGEDSGFDPVPPNPAVPVVLSETQWLYVQTAETAQMISDTTLVMPVTRDIFGFTDRPHRQHEWLSAGEFASYWDEGEGGNSFYTDPPNAVLTWVDGAQTFEAEVIINDATVNVDNEQESLSYEVTLDAAVMPLAQLSAVSLFIDAGTPSNFSFLVEFSDGFTSVFQEVDGIDCSSPNLLPAVPNLTLRRGVFPNDKGFWEWHASVVVGEEDGVEAAGTVVVSLFDEADNLLTRWSLNNAEVIGFYGMNLESNGSNVEVGSITLAYETCTTG